MTESETEEYLKNGFIQLVNYEEEFNSSVSHFIRHVGLYDAGFDYHVVAVMGCQSSGKSTLLNLLFSTKFQTMDAKSGRYQVTQGIWLSKDRWKPILVLDLEGTDSRERGEEAASFERKSTLFALALAEVLIVNMWAQDVGRYVAANLALLRTVLELNLQLFQNDREHRKTKLLFVLRDHVETSLDLLANTIRTDLEATWKSLQKPLQFENSQVEDFFDLQFVSLPHMVLKPEQFEASVKSLREGFHDEDEKQSIFHPEYRRLVAADGFTTYAYNIWETIRSNKEVDIPSQREMLATVRCEEIAEEAYQQAHKKLEDWNLELDALKKKTSLDDSRSLKYIKGLPDLIFSTIREAVSTYSDSAKRYVLSVAEAKKAKLQERLEMDGKALYLGQLSLIESISLAQLEADLEKLASRSKPWMNFQSEVTNILEKYNKWLQEAASCSVGDAYNLFKNIKQTKEDDFAQQATKIVERYRRSILDRTVEILVETFGTQYRSKLTTVLESSQGNVWESIRSPLCDLFHEQLSHLEDCLHMMQCNERDNLLVLQNSIFRFKEEVEVKTRELLSSNTVIVSYLSRKFDNSFRKDSRGVPRVWKPGDDLDSLYLEAKQETEVLLDTLSEVEIHISLKDLFQNLSKDEDLTSVEEFDIAFEVFSVERKTNLQVKLEDYMKTAYTEAKRAQETIHTRSQVPGWLYIVMFLLGFNEMMAVLRRPLLLLLFIVLSPILYVVVQSNLHTMLLSMLYSKLEQHIPRIPVIEESTAGIKKDESASGAFNSPIPNRAVGYRTAMSTGVRYRKGNLSVENITRRRRNSDGQEE
eukprot:jgi/Galph1/1158/GphlegSOOS_G5738.1